MIKKKKKTAEEIIVSKNKRFRVIIRAFQYFMEAIVYYLLVACTALAGLPFIFSYMGGALGIQLGKSNIIDIVVLWWLPCLFVMAVIFVLVLVIIKTLHRLFNSGVSFLCDKQFKNLKNKLDKKGAVKLQ